MCGLDVDEGDDRINGCFCTFANDVVCYNTTEFKHKEVVAIANEQKDYPGFKILEGLGER